MLNIILDLEKIGIKLWSESGKLRVSVPKEKAYPEIKSMISNNKDNILDILNKNGISSEKDFDNKIKYINIQDIPNLNLLEDIYPASYLQKGMLFESSHNPLIYHNVAAYTINKKFDKALFLSIWKKLFDKHQLLRAGFIDNDNYGYLVLIFKEIDIDSKIDIFEKSNFKDIFNYEKEKPFNISSPGLFRLVIYRDEEIKDSFKLIFTSHHSIEDGWSVASLIDEFINSYINNVLIESNLKTTYKQFVEEEQNALNNKKYNEFWKNYLSDYNNEYPLLKFQWLDLKTDDYYLSLAKIDNDISRKLLKKSIEWEVPVDSIFMAVYLWLLKIFYNKDDIALGLVANNRLETLDSDKVFGLFLNTIPLRFKISEHKNIKKFVQDVYNEKIKLLEYKIYPYGKIKSDLNSLEEIYQFSFNYVNFHISDENFESGKINIVQGFAKTSIPVMLNVVRSRDNFAIGFDGRSSFINKYYIERLCTLFQHYLKSFVKEDNITAIPENEYELVLNKWNSTHTFYPEDKTIQELFEIQVKKTPDNICIVFQENRLTYRQFNERANQISHIIRKKYHDRLLIGIYIERSLEMITGILGILKSGKAYVPFDTAEPKERLKYKLNDCSLKVILTSSKLKEELCGLDGNSEFEIIEIDSFLDEEDITNPVIINKPNDLAYVLYTSGSTGQPKGVMVEHKSVINTIEALKSVYRLTNDNNRLTAYSSYTFDVSVSEFFVSLLNGGELHILDDYTRNDAFKLSKYLKNNRINYTFLPPAILSVLPDYDYDSLEGIVFAGEPCNQKTGGYWAKKYRLYNYYGPTETTIYATGTRAVTENVNIIGKPINNNYAYVLDNDLNPVPIGVYGELYIGGAGVARGYLNLEKLTKERFIKNPFVPHSRLYKTGDIVRFLPDGNLEFIGRNDTQIKLRGFRIELTEIESKIIEYPEISQCIAVLKIREGSGESSKYIAAYYVSNKSIDEKKLIEFLSSCLPDYMIPSLFVHLNSMPINVSGKIDRKALPEPEITVDENDYIAPQSHLEKQIGEVWCELLNIKRIGIRDDFFRIGGDSILSIQLASRLRNQNIKISVKDIFEYRTIEKISKHISRKRDLKIKSEDGILFGSFDLLPVQKWFFEKGFKKPNHFNQSILVKVPELSIERLNKVIEKIAYHHDALRITFNEDGKQSYNSKIKISDLKILNISGMAIEKVNKLLTDWQAIFDISNVPLWQFGYIYGYPDKTARIYIALHHLIEDAVSLRILIEDIKNIYEGGKLQDKTSSYRQWSETVKEYADKNKSEIDFWKNQIENQTDYTEYESKLINKEIKFNKNITDLLLHKANSSYQTEINDLLLCSLAYSLKDLTHLDTNHITLESHGRENINNMIDVSRTIGWFTTMYPVKLTLFSELSKSIKHIKESLRAIPNKGIGYGALKYYGENEELKNHKLPKIVFNYLGQFDRNIGEYSGTSIHTDNHDDILNINGIVIDGEMIFTLFGRLKDDDFNMFTESFKQNLEYIIKHCIEKDKTEYSPSDFKTVKINQEQIDKLQKVYDIEAIFPATSLQQGFIYHNLSQTEDDAYIIQVIFDYLNKVNLNYLKRAWELTIKTYPILRTSFNWDNEIIQIIDKKADLKWFEHDISDLEDKEAAIYEIQNRDRRERFNLIESGLLRLHIIKQSDEHYTFLMTIHHSITDGWSLALILNRVHDIYKKLAINQSVDVIEEKGYLEAQEYYFLNRKEVETYWNDKLKTIDTVNDINGLLSIRTDLENIRTIKDDNEKVIVIDENTYSNLKNLIHKEGLTISVILQFAWHKMIQAYTEDEQTIVGTIISGRDLPIDGIEKSAGLYINTLPLIIEWKNKTVRDQLKDIHEEITKLNNNGYMNLGSLQKEGKRLFHTLFVFENYPIPKSSQNNPLNLKLRNIIEKLDYPISILANEHDNKLSIKLKYGGEYLKEEKAYDILRKYNIILKQISSKIDELCNSITLLDDKEYDIVVNQLNKIESYNIKRKTIDELFIEQAKKTPENIALVFGDKELNYYELNEKTDYLASAIQRELKGEDRLIGLYIDRSFEMIIGVLAILKAGGAYVPFDTAEPEERLKYKITNCGCKIIVTSLELADKIKSFVDKNIIVLCIDSFKEEKKQLHKINKDLAYLIYTSGTTGNPKGVLQTHHNVIRLFQACNKHFIFTEKDVWTLFHAISFDFTVWEIWGALLYGGKLIIPSFEETRDTSLFYNLLKKHKVTVLNQTPSAFNMLSQFDLEKKEKLEALRYIVFGGEALNLSNLSGWVNKYGTDAPELVNMYGITETTVHVTYKRLYKEDIKNEVSNIGRPLSDLTAYILNRGLKPVPPEIFGELYIGGEGLSPGYLNMKELTNERFIENPYAKEEEKINGINLRLYKTGDLARRLKNGELEYIGRNDNQIKIRGFRIELGEIEKKISEHPFIKQCVVTVNDKAQNRQLIAYYTLKSDVSKNDLQDYLLKKLPGYMIPAYFIELDEIPLTVNGKINRKLLPEPDISGDTDNFVNPRIGLEKRLCE
ncbi:MAG: amino acid adenylation domain-containing protein, partial [Desulfobacterales bacterium]|nr:amino acid adenylation domain-containing protein [Desulfobacterales bacterium]